MLITVEQRSSLQPMGDQRKECSASAPSNTGSNGSINSHTSLESMASSDSHDTDNKDDTNRSNSVVTHKVTENVVFQQQNYGFPVSDYGDDDDDDDDNLQSFQRSLSYSEKRAWNSTSLLYPGLANYQEHKKLQKQIEDNTRNHPFLGLPCEIQQIVLSYLDDTSFRMMQQVSRSMRDLIHKATELNTTLWAHACCQRWPWLTDVPDDMQQGEGCKQKSNVVLVDSLQLPTPLEYFQTMMMDRFMINYGLLLSLAASSNNDCRKKFATKPSPSYSQMQIDETRFLYITTPNGTSAPRFRFVKKVINDNNVDNDNNNRAPDAEEDIVTTTIQYIGDTRVGSRCVRTRIPFFKPQLILNKSVMKNTNRNKKKVLLKRLRRLFQLLNCGATSQLDHHHVSSPSKNNSNNKNDLKLSPYFWKPFVIPFTLSYDSTQNTKQLQLMPRLVKYYEITILPPRPLPWELSPDHDVAREEGAECIAIGIAEESFPLSGRMPGWDNLSYGYHSDDGKVYRGSHDLSTFHGPRRPEDSRLYGPAFGVNDTVGCGIDYENRAIFFTHNGNFLSYAFENLSVDMLSSTTFYPVVGIDTNCPIHFNFGYTDPFVFDLTKYVVDHQKDVLYQTLIYQPDEVAPRSSNCNQQQKKKTDNIRINY